MMHYGYNMIGGYGFGFMVLWWFLGVAITAFVFALIFWLTYNWLVKGKK